MTPQKENPAAPNHDTLIIAAALLAGLFMVKDQLGEWGSNIGKAIDLTDRRKYDWLLGGPSFDELTPEQQAIVGPQVEGGIQNIGDMIGGNWNLDTLGTNNTMEGTGLRFWNFWDESRW